MSRENSLEDIPSHFSGPSSLPGPSTLHPHIADISSIIPGRKASKSVSNTRPNLLSNSKRTQSYHHSTSGNGPSTAPIPSLLSSPSGHSPINPRLGLKRRISTPLMTNRQLSPEVEVDERAEKNDQIEGKRKTAETRARSTSTSLVVPGHDSTGLIDRGERFGIGQPPQTAPLPSKASISHPTPPSPWAPIFVTPASPDEPLDSSPSRSSNLPENLGSRSGSGILTKAYNLGESSILRLTRFIRPNQHIPSKRRGSDEDSEKGLDGSDEGFSTETRTSEDSLRRNGKYWGIWTNEEDDQDPNQSGYFSLPPTPPEEKSHATFNSFEAAIQDEYRLQSASLPTPALSTRSLSSDGSRRLKKIMRGDVQGEERNGWLSTVYRIWAGLGNGNRSGKTGEVMRELGWTVGLLVALFFVTAALALWVIRALPITQLKHIPSSTTDLQLLSAEIRKYMASSDIGFWHTIGVLTFVGCWKHAWSVPGAVVLNILVGSVLEPIPALALLTVITATGSLFSYLLSRPLAPLIAVLFPKPLALVRAALAPDFIPISPNAISDPDEKVTAIQLSSDPASPAIGGEDKVSVWRRLLIMRAMGFVPWSGMNVACGVVGVDWRVFWLTTAAGSASWSYVTASVGNILSRLAIPQSALEGGAPEDMIGGESLTSLLRDPILLTKLVFLSALTLLPVVLKRRNGVSTSVTPDQTPRSSLSIDGTPIIHPHVSRLAEQESSPISPTSPLSRSLARFTPTPAAFDLLSFGRTVVRQGGRVVIGGVRGTVGAVERLTGGGR